SGDDVRALANDDDRTAGDEAVDERLQLDGLAAERRVDRHPSQRQPLAPDVRNTGPQDVETVLFGRSPVEYGLAARLRQLDARRLALQAVGAAASRRHAPGDRHGAAAAGENGRLDQHEAADVDRVVDDVERERIGGVDAGVD